MLITGANIRTAQDLLRHASPVMTLGTYAQAITEDKRDALGALASLFTDVK
jgi:integrase